MINEDGKPRIGIPDNADKNLETYKEFIQKISKYKSEERINKINP